MKSTMKLTPDILNVIVTVLKSSNPGLTADEVREALEGIGAKREINAPLKSGEVCRLLKVSPPTLARYVKAGIIKKSNLSSHAARYDYDSVMAVVSGKASLPETGRREFWKSSPNYLKRLAADGVAEVQG